MSEISPQGIERRLADLSALQQELEKMMARVDHGRRKGSHAPYVAGEPVLVIRGK